MKRKIFSTAMCVVLTITILSVTPFAMGATLTVDASKIDSKLLSVIQSSPNDILIPVSIWFNDTITENIEDDVKSKIGFNKTNINNATTKKLYSSDLVDNYITTEREIYSQKQMEKHNSFLAKTNWVSSNTKNKKENKIIYASKYAPMILAELTADEIEKLTYSGNVKCIYHNPKLNGTNSSDLSIPITAADYVRDYIGCSGTGIKIGMIEYEGTPNLNYTFLGNNITLDSSLPAAPTDHATLVAAIMVGGTTSHNNNIYRGIVPDAQLYATYWNDDSINWYSRVEWLISQGVNVINMSAGFYSDNWIQTYSTYEIWTEHIAINHNIHFVMAAGNTHPIDDDTIFNPNFYILNPGHAYNVITVGNLNDNNSPQQNNHIISETSAFVESYGSAYKPDLVAPGENIGYSNMAPNSGTSFSAPHVTAIVAQLCQDIPALKTQQAAMKAILTASITHTTHIYTPYNDAYNMYGAGVVDAYAAWTCAIANQYISTSFAANALTPATRIYSFNVNYLYRFRISLAWLRNISINSSPHSNMLPSTSALADLDLEIYDPDGISVGFSITSHNNVEIVDFTPVETGTYTIEVTLYSTSTKTIHYALAWY